MTQTEDVLVDTRVLIDVTDNNWGLWIVRYTARTRRRGRIARSRQATKKFSERFFGRSIKPDAGCYVLRQQLGKLAELQ